MYEWSELERIMNRIGFYMPSYYIDENKSRVDDKIFLFDQVEHITPNGVYAEFVENEPESIIIEIDGIYEEHNHCYFTNDDYSYKSANERFEIDKNIIIEKAKKNLPGIKIEIWKMDY